MPLEATGGGTFKERTFERAGEATAGFEIAVKLSKVVVSRSKFVDLIRRSEGEGREFGWANLMRVNFDAEHIDSRSDLGYSDLERNAQYRYSETLQTSALDARAQSRRLLRLYMVDTAASVNFVHGNRNYRGCNGNAERLEEVVSDFYALLRRVNKDHSYYDSKIKIGAEGIKNGYKAIEIAKRYHATLYLLQNKNTAELLMQAKRHKLHTAMYTMARFNSSVLGRVLGRSKENALKEFLEMGGENYLIRRGERDARKNAHHYVFYGSIADIRSQVLSWLEAGVDTFVFNLVSKDIFDFERQFYSLRTMAERYFGWDSHINAAHFWRDIWKANADAYAEYISSKHGSDGASKSF